MQRKPSLTPSQYRARTLLAAWNSGDLDRLQGALESEMDQPRAREGGEQERMELVESAGGSIRTWLTRPQDPAHADLQVSLRLLRHLAA